MQHRIANLDCMMIPIGVRAVCSPNAAPALDARAHHLKCGDQARGGRWGSSGMNRVYSNGMRAASIDGAAGMLAISVGTAADTTWWQQEWPPADSVESVLPW